jgi:exodeoxyribonuclease V alpha subunit
MDLIEDIQVLTLMHRGVIGAAQLNAALQVTLNPPKPDCLEVMRGGRVYRVGDRVMQIRNNYDKEVYNGDIGRIVRIDPEEQEVSVRVDDRTVTYDFSELDELALAYAATVHKSQGSEYPAVILPMHTTHYPMLQRNLLYTAISRAKRLLVLVGMKKAVAIAVRNDAMLRRHSRLAERLLGLRTPQTLQMDHSDAEPKGTQP